MKIKQFIFLILTGMVILGGCALQNESAKFSKPVVLSGNAMVVVYREGGNEQRVASVWVDDRIIGTLLPSHYAQSFVCPGKRSVSVATHQHGSNLIITKDFIVKKGEVLYLKVWHDNSIKKFNVHKVNESDAEATLSTLQTKSHIMNRHRACKQNYIELDADSLFVFGKSELTPAGKTMLDGLAANLHKNVAVKKLRITGHSDRIGDSAANDRLSLARANAVSAYLRSKNVTVPIETIGLGERVPLSKGCVGEKPTPELLKCLAPDRRVKIEIIGLATKTVK